MNNQKRITSLRLLAFLFAVCSVTTGCIKDDLSGCNNSVLVTVKAYDNQEYDVLPDEISHVVLYVFNDEHAFVREVEGTINQPISIEGSPGEMLTLIAWANLDEGIRPQLTHGDLLDDCHVRLQLDTRASSSCIPPNDLFRGTTVVTIDQQQQQEKTLPIYREMGSMTITVRNLREYAGYPDGNYSVVVGETRSRIDFKGNISGEHIDYRPGASFRQVSGKEEYYVPSFCLMPENNISIDLYHGTQLVERVTLANQLPITVKRGELTNVLIELGASLDVSVALSRWGNEVYWKEY